MKRLIIGLMIALYGLIPGLVLTQGRMDQPDPIPTMPSLESSCSPRSPSAPEPLLLKSPYDYAISNFRTQTRYSAPSPSQSPIAASLNKVFSFIMVNQPGKLTPVPDGLRVGSGFTCSVPFASSLSAFATFNPGLGNFYGPPEAMLNALATGLQIPLLKGSPNGGNLSLKFTTQVDQQFRPMFFFSLSTPFHRFDAWANYGRNPAVGPSRSDGAF